MTTGTPPGTDGPGEVGGQPASVTCSHCGRSFGFAEQRPLFCAFCGKPIPPPAAPGAAAPVTRVDEGATLATSAPGAGPLDVPPLSPVRGVFTGHEPAGRTVGGYRLLRKLGGGGMGAVYEAEESAGGRRVALKVIAPGQELSADSVERFRREGRLASTLSHPRCVFVYAADEDAGRPYIVMELMPGETLADLCRRNGPLPPGEAVAKILDVLDGLREAHRLGVVHRDVKPSNCFLEADGRVKVGDFGLSKSLAGDTKVTGTGAFLGTPAFASPEQVRGEPAGPQSDVYSLAATLYYLLVGRAPFEGADAVATLARIVSDSVPPLRSVRPELPPELDRAVLRGLERDRNRRWRDLDAFREALLPFLPGRKAATGLGLRLAAFLADGVLISGLGTLLQLGIARVTGKSLPESALDSAGPAVFVQLVAGLGLWFLYFCVPEWLWGCTPGKRLLTLRVCTLSGTDPPSLGQEALRCAVFIALLYLGSLILAPLVFWRGYDLREKERQLMFIAVVFYPAEILGVGALLSTMRRRNGWRGLHEIVSGTRVVQVAGPARRRTHGTSRLDDFVSRPEGLPGQVGPFPVRGALRWDEERVLLGEDPALCRPVLLWLRQAGEDALSPGRRDCARSPRLRWLAAGEQEGWRWDAFPAPAGRPLSELVAEKGPLPWSDVRLLLEQLAEELTAAAGEGSLPPCLAVGQVWVQPGGGALLLDTPLHGEAEPGGEDSPLAFLARVMVLALEGRPRPGARRVRAPLPIHAARLARRLMGQREPFPDVEAFRAELAATRERPTEVSHGHSAARVAAVAVALSFGLCCCMLPQGLMGGPTGFMDLTVRTTRQKEHVQALQEWEAGSAADFTAAVLAAPPLALPAVTCRAADQWLEDQQLADRLRANLEREERDLQDHLAAASWLNRSTFDAVERQREAVGEPYTVRRENDFRARAKRLAAGPSEWEVSEPDKGMGIVALIFVLVWPVLWVIWALIWRGGLTYYLTGLSLVRSDGLPAGRLRCAYRALLVWGPPVVLMAGALALDLWHWSLPREARVPWWPWVTDAMRWGGFVTLVIYPVLALCFPRRGPHDWLAGTYVVPR